jgi:hypothetical protein
MLKVLARTGHDEYRLVVSKTFRSEDEGYQFYNEYVGQRVQCSEGGGEILARHRDSFQAALHVL